MTPHDLIAAFEAVAEAPQGVERLRELVLKLAVRGRLVPQDPANEPASVLIQKIRDSGFGSRASDAAAVDALDARWELPTSWCWVRLSEIANFSLGRTPPTKDSRFWEDEGGHPWVSIADMEHYGEVSATKRRVSDKAATEVFRTPPVPKGTILMSFKLTIGKVARLAVDGYHNEAIISVFPAVAGMDGYMFRFLPLVAAGVETNAAVKGQTLNSASLTNLLVPLPPLAEQHRVVARVDELMGLLARLEAAGSSRDATRASARDSTLGSLRQADTPEEIEVAWNRFAERVDDLVIDPNDIAPLRQTVLDLAVRGKLVTQDPADEPARKRLAGRMSGLPSDEAPFTLPNGWEWSSISKLGGVLGGGTPSKSNSAFWGGQIPWVTPKDMKRDFIADSEDHVTESALTGSAVKRVPPGSLLMVVRGMILAHSFPTALTVNEVTVNQDMKALVPFDPVIAQFLLIATKGLKRSVLRLVERSTHGTCKLPTQALLALAMPIPPWVEQQRIADRVKELMRLLDRLEERLSAARGAHASFAAAAVHHLDA